MRDMDIKVINRCNDLVTDKHWPWVIPKIMFLDSR